MSDKLRINIKKSDLKIRRKWHRSPIERVKESKKDFKHKLSKKEIDEYVEDYRETEP